MGCSFLILTQVVAFLIFLFQVTFLLSGEAYGEGPSSGYEVVHFPPCDPVFSPWLDSKGLGGLVIASEVSSEISPQFCRQWNPDYSWNGHQCCGKAVARRGHRKKGGIRGSCGGKKRNYCDEMTTEQRSYAEAVQTGKIGDLLGFLTRDLGRRGDQAFCSVNNGFLANGRPIVATASNHIAVRSPERCLHFGTDSMVTLIEWLGREVARHFSDAAYSGVRLVIGDVARPRGGCVIGRSGRRGHASHTTGQDADIGFLSVKKGQESPLQFVREFDAVTQWWLLKRILQNPFGCVKAIFLDRKHIRSLEKVAKHDSEWVLYHMFIRHMPGHKNHFHVRVGNGPGKPGCVPGADPESEDDFEFSDEPDESDESVDSVENFDIHEQLNQSQTESKQPGATH